MTAPRTFDEAVVFAQALMAEDPRSMRVGYTLENAAIAVAEVFGFDRAALEDALRSRIAP